MRADVVTDWNAILLHIGNVTKSSPLVMSRNAAIVHAAIFDAVNGIEGRYRPFRVAPAAPPGSVPARRSDPGGLRDARQPFPHSEGVPRQ